MDIGIQLVKDFSQLSGIPCWGVSNVYGSLLRLNFGQPSLEIREPVPDAKSEHLRMGRRVSVRGEFEFCLESCDWKIFVHGDELAHSESDSKLIGQAIAHIDGQVLNHVRITLNPTGMEFVFDLGGVIKAQRYSDSKPGDGLWHFYIGTYVYSLTASGKIEYGQGTDKSPILYDIDELNIKL
jgi:hypothetical protein